MANLEEKQKEWRSKMKREQKEQRSKMKREQKKRERAASTIQLSLDQNGISSNTVINNHGLLVVPTVVAGVFSSIISRFAVLVSSSSL